MAPVVIDARGHKCPVPSLKLRKAMEHVPAGQVMELLATDPMARIDVPFLMQETGGRVIDILEEEGVLRLTIETGGGRPD